MKRIILNLVLVMATALAFCNAAWAQAPPQCRVSKTFYTTSGAADRAATLTVFKIILSGQIYSQARTVFRTNASGVLLGQDGAPGVLLPQGATVWLYSNATGLAGIDKNQTTGTAYLIPNSASVALDQLALAPPISEAVAGTVLRAKGDLITGNSVGLAARLPVGTDNQVLVADASQALGLRWATGGSGAITSVFGRTGVVVAQSGDYAAFYALLSHAHAQSDVTGLVTALAAKEATIAAGLSSQYWRGDKTWQTLDKAAVGLANVDNTSDANKPISTSTQTALNGKEATIAAGLSSQYWRGDKTWQALDKVAVGLGNVDNTSDANKPISTAVQTALNGKESTIAAGLSSQYWRGDKTWQTLDKAAVGLGNVDNTSDANKPISTAVQTALNGKQALDADLTSIAGLAGTSGLLRKTAADTWTLDTDTYLTGNQTVTLSGDATGSGATSIAVTLASSGVTAGTYTKLTVDAKGRATVGAALSAGDLPAHNQAWSTITTTPTTLAGYGITDAAALSHTQAWSTITATPTTFAGYGLSDTSANLAAALTNETGSGAAVFGTAPTIAGGSITALTSFGIRSSGTGAFDVTLANAENLTAARTLTLALGDTNRTLTLAGNATVSGTNSGDQTITLSGDATGSGTSGVAVTLANSGVTAGTYTKLTVDAKGRVTVGASLSAGDLPAHNQAWSTITATPTTLAGYGITDAAALSHTQAWSTITATPTTFAGYGISDTSANLAAALTNETGSGAAVFGTAPTIAGGSVTGLTSFGIRSSGTGAFDVTLANTENLTAARTLTLA